MRILVFCPTYPKRPLVRREMLDTVLNLDWPSCDIVFSREDAPSKPNRAEFHHDLLWKYTRARELALTLGYGALLLVEADIIVPHDVVHRLLQTGADVAYGLYCSRNPHYGHNWLLDLERGSYLVEPASKDADFRQQAWGRVVPSFGHGLGCTLIRRGVLEDIPFRLPEEAEVASDWYFALDCQAAGIHQAHHCGVVCGHADGDEILWPDPVVTCRRTNIGG